MSRLPIETKEKAYSLRRKGYSVKEVSKILNIAQSTSSLWIRDIILNEKAKKRLEQRCLLGHYKSSLRHRLRRLALERKNNSKALVVLRKARKDINHSKIYCALLFGCEGAKSDTKSVKFINSDPMLVKTFLALLRKSFSVDESKLRALIHLHSYHNERKQKGGQRQ